MSDQPVLFAEADLHPLPLGLKPWDVCPEPKCGEFVAACAHWQKRFPWLVQVYEADQL